MKANVLPLASALTAELLCLLAVQPAHAQYFTNTGTMSTARESHAAVLLPDGRVLVSGGVNKTNYLSSVEI